MVYFAYNILAPTNITNMYGNWLNGVSKDDKARIRVGISALCWSIWTCRNDIVGDQFFAGYSPSYPLDSAMGVLAPEGSAGGYGYWMQPAADGCSGLLFSGYWVAAY
jgi:hypothetical protein